MFRNYGKIAIRNLMRNKVFSFINIAGLGLGIACSLFIYLWVQDERSYDHFHAHGRQLFKVILHDVDKHGNITGSMDATQGLLAEALKKDIPEITHSSTLVWEDEDLFTVGDKKGMERGRYAHPDFFDMFSFPLLRGNPQTALSSPANIVISRKLAEAYFGGIDKAMGKIVRIDDKKDYTVSGVTDNIPENSSIRFDFMIHVKNRFEQSQYMVAGWNHYGPPTYVMLRADASPEKVNAKIRDYIRQKDPKVDDKQLSLQPFGDSYLYTRFTKGIADGGRIEYVRLFSIVSVFILLIACINFMNLATARSVKRAREVGVRKAIGAERKSLFIQFISEAFFTTFLAMVVAIALVVTLLPLFNTITEKNLRLHQLLSPVFIAALPCILLFTGFVSGSYPALFLSALKPVSVLKGTLKFGASATLFRKGLVVFQFALSIMLIIGTVLAYQQIHYVQTKNLGMDRENVVYVPMLGDLHGKYDAFRNEMLGSGYVKNISTVTSTPTRVDWWSNNISWQGKDPNQKAGFVEMGAGYDFLATMKIKLVAGRGFSPAYGTDSVNYLVNEEAVKVMKMEHPIGQTFAHLNKTGKIIGVMKNFHINSLHHQIPPLFLAFQPDAEANLAVIRTQPGRTKEVLATLERCWQQLNPRYPVNYLFADDQYNRFYRSEMMIGRLANIFAFLAVFISCLGLFGLSMFMAEQRIKEIGIRKVMGAGVTSILALFSKDFLILVGIAALVAFPLAWWAMSRWLEGFAYRIPIGWDVFALAGMAAIVIALLTISFQALKTAMANPIKSLRTE